MSKIIVLITGSYPYGKGEPFLEEEIRYIKCDKLIILTLAEDGAIRPINSESPCKVFRLKKNTRFKWGVFAAYRAFSKKALKELKNLRNAGKWSVKAMLQSLSFLAHSSLYAKQAIRILAPLLKPGDSICFYGYWLLLQASIAAELKKHFGGAAVARCHGGDLYEERNANGVLPMRQYLLEQLDAVYPISENGKLYIENRYPYAKQKIQVNRLGTQNGTPMVVHKSDARFSIVSCSWISEVKRVNRMISVLSRLPDRNVEWTHFGGGELLGETERLAYAVLDCKMKWQFTGTLSHDEIMKSYSESNFHLFLNLSSSEGIPVSIMEACSYGIPVIATDVGGTSEIVTDGYNGFLIGKDFTDEEVIAAIERLLRMTDDEYCQFRRNSYKRWQDRFSAEKNYSDFYINLPYGLLNDGK